jgi:hypothetical protein
MSWEFLLHPADGGRMRLLVRARVSPRWHEMASVPSAARAEPILIERVYGVLARLPTGPMLAAAGFGHRVMQNRQLRGIRRRAEGVERSHVA